MTDNIDVLPSPDGTAVPVITDEVGGVHIPIYKIGVSTDGTLPTSVDNENPLPVNDHGTDVALGMITGRSVIFTPSNNNDVGLTEVDIWDESGDYPYSAFATAQALELVSDDANDTSAGTGAQTVTIITLGDGFVEQAAQVVTLNGTTAVALTGTHQRVRRMVVATAGSGEKNAGTLTLRLASGGTTVCTAKPGNNRSLLSQFTVPAGKVALFKKFVITVGKGQDAKCKLRFRPQGGVFSSGAPLNVYQNDLQRPFDIPIFFGEKVDIKFTAISENTGTDVSVTYDIELVDESFVGSQGL